MTLRDWVAETREHVSRHGARTGSTVAARQFYTGLLRRVGRVWNYGTPVYERDWDLLVVLDACRVDALEAVSDEYEFLPGEVPARYSVASSSAEWMEKTFAETYRDRMRETAYVSGNIFTRDLSADEFALLDEVWRYGWSEERETVPPRPITDRAIEAAERGHERVIAHYMQPHGPYRTLQEYRGFLPYGDGGDTDGPMKMLERGEMSREELLAAYVDNLRWVLDDVALLLRNVDAERVAISADHAELFGEYGCYGHPEDVPLPPLKAVPWVETTATDADDYVPSTRPRRERRVTERTVERRLNALGYTDS